ncbi:MAG: hypothetical protein HQL80_07165 [Magnetococcales bacterium]|nr:hypothetical protein [Magnetococcales bacterium]
MCQPVWNRFLATAQAAGLIGNQPIRLQWTPPRFEAVDPQKDIMAEILAVRAGLVVGMKTGLYLDRAFSGNSRIA